jgi:hypothetical protein
MAAIFFLFASANSLFPATGKLIKTVKLRVRWCFGVFLMVKSKPKTADEIFSKIDDDIKLIAERLRNLVKATLPKATETVRRGKFTYTLKGRDCVAIRLAKQHVDLLFMHGASLSSPHLKGQGTIDDPKRLEVATLKNFDERDAKRLLLEEAATATAT